MNQAVKLFKAIHGCDWVGLSKKIMPVENIQYSDRYSDEKYEYRHVILPLDLAKKVPKNHLMTETEWRNLGVQQSPGWIHYMMHGPEPHILLFRRLKQEPVPQPRPVAVVPRLGVDLAVD